MKIFAVLLALVLLAVSQLKRGKPTVETIYRPPTRFCAFPSLGYWEVDGKPVSSREALEREALCDRGSHLARSIWRESEISRELHLHTGWLEEVAV